VTVLILSNRRDAHVPPVVAELERRNANVLRLDTDTLWSESQLEFWLEEGATISGRLTTPLQQVELSDITAVWYRRPESPTFDQLGSREAIEFAQHETQAAVDNLVALLSRPNVRWLSHPEAIRRAGGKVRQLADAATLGLKVPSTLVSGNPESVRRFAAGCEQTIAKLLSKGVPRTAAVADQYTIFTNILSPEQLMADQDIAVCASIYQPYIVKAFELRVTLVGRNAMSCRIDSQVTDSTRIDWRNYDLENTPHTPYELPQHIGSKLFELMASYGLAFAAVDLIVTPEGEFVFLELNPNGQWLWLQELAGLNIASAIASYLSGFP